MTTDIAAATGPFVHITGTDTITGLGTALKAGIVRKLVFDGALILTHHATNLILPTGANITTAAGDVAEFVSEDNAGAWRCANYETASGVALVPPTTYPIALGTEQASTSGTSIDFTGIPAGVKKIVVSMVGVSTSGVSPIMCQLRDAGGIEATGYAGAVWNTPGTVITAHNTGFQISVVTDAADVYHTKVTLDLEDAAGFTWMADGMFTNGANNTRSGGFCGAKSLSAELDGLSITTVGGSDTFDAGAINISYES
ncbi:hypothetical protein ACFL48_04995 [Pseudomonadota bacterium]